MTILNKTMALAASGMQAQASRLRHVSENIANADTPGYHRKVVSFHEVIADPATRGEVRVGRVRLDRTGLEKIYDPASPLADETGHYDGSNVNPTVWMTLAFEE